MEAVFRVARAFTLLTNQSSNMYAVLALLAAARALAARARAPLCGVCEPWASFPALWACFGLAMWLEVCLLELGSGEELHAPAAHAGAGRGGGLHVRLGGSADPCSPCMARGTSATRPQARGGGSSRGLSRGLWPVQWLAPAPIPPCGRRGGSWRLWRRQECARPRLPHIRMARLERPASTRDLGGRP